MKTKSAYYQMTTWALMAAVMCVLSPLTLPIGPIPVSLATFVLYLSVFLLGTKGAAISCVIYLLLGAMGMPVFSGFQGGLAKLAGPTGGYLVGYIFIPLIGGLIMEKAERKPVITAIGFVAATAVLYLLGTAWFMVQTGSTLSHALAVCVVPFIPVDCGKIVVAVLFGTLIRNALIKAHLL